MSSKGNLLINTTRKLISRNAIVPLSKMINKLHPADIAQVINQLSNTERNFFFSLITSKELGASVISELEPMTRSDLLAQLDTNLIPGFFKEMSPDDLTDIIADMPKDIAAKVLESLGKKDLEEVQELLKYPKDTAGGIMSPQYLAFRENITVEESLEKLRTASDVEQAFYIYVVDDYEHLTGIVSLRKMITSSKNTCLKDIMRHDVISVNVEEDQEEVARIVAHYNILAVPVVDRFNKIVGVVTVDDIIDVIRAETTEDIYKMAGTSQEELFEKSVWKVASIRLPWLLISLTGETISGLIMRAFGHTLNTIIAITFFIPMMMALGGNVGNQSQTIVVRGLATGRIMDTEKWKILFKQVRIGMVMGILAASTVSVIILLFQPVKMLAFVVGLSLFISITISGMMGAVTPFLLKQLNIDPAIAAGPFITNFNDVISIFIYLGLATIMMSYLV